MSFAAIIPAAGNSGRMGRNKAFLQTGDGITFAQHLVNCFGLSGCKPVLMVVNENFDSTTFHAENLVIIINHHLEKGRSWSVYLGVQQVPQGSACFIQNIDNPFVGPGLLDLLIEPLTPDGYSVPVYDSRGGHPILLGCKVVDFLRHQTESYDFRQILQQFTRFEVPFPDERILWNINTPDDYTEFINWTRRKDKNL
jgi:CTP:molybdopterin cytidylyltransferase MocA